MNRSPVPDAGAQAPFRAALALPRDILIAPDRAFAAVTATGAWLPPYAAIVLLGVAAGFCEWPALAHVVATVPDASGNVPRGAAALEASSRSVLANVLVGETLTPLIFIGITAMVLTVVARVKSNATRYGAFAALAAACLIPSALGDFLSAIVVRAHDPSTYHDYRSLLLALPDSLGVFAAKGNENELFFLSRFGLFDLWSYALLAFGIAALVPVRFTTAVILAFSLELALSLIN